MKREAYLVKREAYLVKREAYLVVRRPFGFPFDPFDYPFDFAQGYGLFRAGYAQGRLRSGLRLIQGKRGGDGRFCRRLAVLRLLLCEALRSTSGATGRKGILY